MPPKKKENKASGEIVEGEDPLQLWKNYSSFCKTSGLTPNNGLYKLLNDEEKYPIEQIIVDDEFGQLGPGGTRALTTAIMGSGPGMKGGPYKLVKSLRFWKTNVGDEGAASIAEVLRLGGGDVKISYLEIIDNDVGPRGGVALGIALSHKHNLSLLTLKLDFNTSFGSQGCQNLCRGLRTNFTLRQLYLTFCNITADGGAALGEVLANSRSGLEVLSLTGNRLGGLGLKDLCQGLQTNVTLQSLGLADNMIEQTEDDSAGLSALRDCLLVPDLGLISVDLLFNRIGESGALILAPALTDENKKIKEFLVDLTLPMPIFEMIFRKGGKKDSKSKSKKGKKK